MSKREIYRILDAAANRGREALRVVEDAARFLGDSEELTTLLKTTRHRFAAAADKLDRRERMLARDTVGDVGVEVEAEDEYRRASLVDVLVANFARLEESARSLEEFSKIVEPSLAREWEQLRYSAYTLEKLAYQAASAFDTEDEQDLRTSEPRQTEIEQERRHGPSPDASHDAPAYAPEASPEDDAEAYDDALDATESFEDERRNAAESVVAALFQSVTNPRALHTLRSDKLANASLNVVVDRVFSPDALVSLLRSNVDAFEVSYNSPDVNVSAAQIDAFLNWQNETFSQDATRDDRPLLFLRDPRLWNEAFDGWIVPVGLATFARETVGPDALVGVIVSTRDETLDALRLWNEGVVDFLEAGPVFQEDERGQATTSAFIRAIMETLDVETPIPIFAFGGVDEKNCLELFDSGIERVVIGAEVLDPDAPASSVDRFRELF